MGSRIGRRWLDRVRVVAMAGRDAIRLVDASGIEVTGHGSSHWSEEARHDVVRRTGQSRVD